jgi:hypothetical protein
MVKMKEIGISRVGCANPSAGKSVSSRSWFFEQFSFLRFLVLFFVLYVLVVPGVYLLWPKLWTNNVVAFLTSPFNFSENFASLYGTPLEGLINNYALTVVILFFSFVYPHVLRQTRRVGPEAVFLGSLVGSYLVSVLAWWLKGTPTTGTSIIGFCMILYLIPSTFLDARALYSSKVPRTGRSIGESLRFLSILLLLTFSLVLFSGYWLYPAYIYHLAGAAVCGIVVLTSVRLRAQKSAMRATRVGFLNN